MAMTLKLNLDFLAYNVYKYKCIHANNKTLPYLPTMYFKSRWGCLPYVMQNCKTCKLFVSGLLLAIDQTTPYTLC